jgi:hypothetical protein
VIDDTKPMGGVKMLKGLTQAEIGALIQGLDQTLHQLANDRALTEKARRRMMLTCRLARRQLMRRVKP